MVRSAMPRSRSASSSFLTSCRMFGTRRLLLCLLISAVVGFEVSGPKEALEVTVGEDGVLRCQVEQALPLMNLEVRWVRQDWNSPVYLYRDRKEQLSVQDKAYQGRTEMDSQQISAGNFSLMIKNVQPPDNGSYTCFVKLSEKSNEALAELKVRALGEAPLLHTEGYQNGGIRLSCHSEGWFPEPQILWGDGSRRNMTAQSQTSHVKDSKGFFTTKSSVTVSSDSTDTLTCQIRNRLLNKDQEAMIMISEEMFPRVSAWMVLFILLLVVLPMAVAGTVFIWRKQTTKIKKRDGLNDNIARTDESLKLITNVRIQLKKALDIEKRCTESEWDKYRKCNDCKNQLEQFEGSRLGPSTASVVLDPKTAHPDLIVSQDGLSVSLGDHPQKVGKSTNRFSSHRAVLGIDASTADIQKLNGFATGIHSWEVELGKKTAWTIGVARESIKRNENITLTPDNGFWVVSLSNGEDYQALTSPSTKLSLSVKPGKIGIYLDFEGGRVSFYNADNMSLLHTFTHAFTERLYPLFCPGSNEKGTNSDPLKICAVNKEEDQSAV
eukprot:gi/632935871/ref/XP_007891622.1/ PREDICTED: butyrophilin subfamily 3 member A1-like [Callorhinchus milii]